MGHITVLLKTRASVRQFQPQPVPPGVLADILEAGRLSPSGGNEQPWRFGVITDPALIADLAQLAYRQTWMAQAPLLIVLCITPVSDEAGGRDIQAQRYPEQAAAIRQMEPALYWALNQEEHQTKIAGTHMLLAALEQGVGGCWVSRFDVRAVARRLNLPRNILPAEILALGYPARSPKPLRKKPLKEIVFYNALT